MKAVYEVSADRNAEITLRAAVLDGKSEVASAAQTITVTAGNKTKAELEIHLPNAKLRDTEDPHLHTMRATVIENNTELDTDKTRFGDAPLAPYTRGFAPSAGSQRCSTSICYLFENYCNLLLQFAKHFVF